MKKLLVLSITVLLVLSFASSSFASIFEHRTTLGYMHLTLDDLDSTISPASPTPMNYAYTDSTNLLGISKVPNLCLGFKTATGFWMETNGSNPQQTIIITSAVSAVAEYTFSLSKNFLIGAGVNAGVNTMSLILRKIPGTTVFGDLVTTDRNYASLWRPYVQLGAYLTLTYKIGYIFNINLSAGYNYNIAIAPWLDIFKPIDGSKDVQKNFNAFFVNIGVGLTF